MINKVIRSNGSKLGCKQSWGVFSSSSSIGVVLSFACGQIVSQFTFDQVKKVTSILVENSRWWMYIVQHLYISIYCTVDFLHISQPWSSSLFFAGGNRWQWSRRKIKHDSTLLQGHFYEELQENYRCRFPRKTHHVRWLLLLEKFVYFPFKSKHFEIIWMKLAENIFHNNAQSVLKS